MDGMSYTNLMMLTASIPDLTKSDADGEIDSNNWQKYVSK